MGILLKNLPVAPMTLSAMRKQTEQLIQLAGDRARTHMGGALSTVPFPCTHWLLLAMQRVLLKLLGNEFVTLLH